MSEAIQLSKVDLTWNGFAICYYMTICEMRDIARLKGDGVSLREFFDHWQQDIGEKFPTLRLKRYTWPEQESTVDRAAQQATQTRVELSAVKPKFSPEALESKRQKMKAYWAKRRAIKEEV